MKKLSGIVVLGQLLSGNVQASILCRTLGIACPSMSGCVYDELGNTLDCVNIKFMGKTGLTHSDATRICLSLVREMLAERGLALHTGGECVY